MDEESFKITARDMYSWASSTASYQRAQNHSITTAAFYAILFPLFLVAVGVFVIQHSRYLSVDVSLPDTEYNSGAEFYTAKITFKNCGWSSIDAATLSFSSPKIQIISMKSNFPQLYPDGTLLHGGNDIGANNIVIMKNIRSRESQVYSVEYRGAGSGLYTGEILERDIVFQNEGWLSYILRPVTLMAIGILVSVFCLMVFFVVKPYYGNYIQCRRLRFCVDNFVKIHAISRDGGGTLIGDKYANVLEELQRLWNEKSSQRKGEEIKGAFGTLANMESFVWRGSKYKRYAIGPFSLMGHPTLIQRFHDHIFLVIVTDNSDVIVGSAHITVGDVLRGSEKPMEFHMVRP